VDYLFVKTLIGQEPLDFLDMQDYNDL